MTIPPPSLRATGAVPSERDAYLHHLRNVLSVIRALIRRTTDSEDGERFAWLDGRIGAFARVQSAAARDSNFKVELRSLIEDEISAVLLEDYIGIAGSEVWLSAQAAGLLALLFHGSLCSIVGIPQDGGVEIRWGPADTSGLSIVFETAQVEREIAIIEDTAWLADAINYELNGILVLSEHGFELSLPDEEIIRR